MATFDLVPSGLTEVAEGSVVKIAITRGTSLQPGDVKVISPYGVATSLDLPTPISSSMQLAWDTTGLQPGTYMIGEWDEGTSNLKTSASVTVTPRPLSHDDTIAVTMRRATQVTSPDLPLWVIIKGSAEALSFDNYKAHMDLVLCGIPLHGHNGEKASENTQRKYGDLRLKRFLHFTDSDSYRLLKVATEAFVMANCAVVLYPHEFTDRDSAELLKRVEVNLSKIEMTALWESYLKVVNGTTNRTLPYLELIRSKFPDLALKDDIFLGSPNGEVSGDDQRCYGIIRDKLQQPCLLELIWSYWHEEGMLVQTIAAITQRFQNRRRANGSDPLANLETDPLRPLNNLLWGYVQDEIHRLSVVRRAYEYDHHYGLRMYGRALSDFRPADSRSKFIEALHNLLNLCVKFYRQDDDTTVVADGFPILNALRDVHLLLSEGAHNQFGDLPGTARVEMLMQQWMLARPEFREFLPTRTMVAYPEPWMDRVDAMKKIQGWTDTNVLHFRNLAMFGEQVFLSIRYGAWADTYDPKQAAGWARFWRAEVQGYVHAYRAVAGVDLSTDVTGKVDTTLPAVHLRNRLLSQMRSSQGQGTLTIPRSRVS